MYDRNARATGMPGQAPQKASLDHSSLQEDWHGGVTTATWPLCFPSWLLLSHLSDST